MTNLLLASSGLPDYTAINPVLAEAAVRSQIDDNRQVLASLLTQEAPTFESFVIPFEAQQHCLNRVFAPLSHLNSVMSSDEVRAAHNNCLTMLTEYQTEIAQNSDLAEAYASILRQESERLSVAQRRVIEHALTEFRLAGVNLPPEKKARFKEVMQELTSLQAKFEEQVLDATQAWSLIIDDAEQLRGLPEHVLVRSAALARERNLAGWVLTLDQPTYLAVITHGESRWLRETLYRAWVTRASDQTPSDPKFNNTDVMLDILKRRHEAAELLGFAHYADVSLATKMAPNATAVVKFLEELGTHYVPAARAELRALETFAGQKLAAWDMPYYADKRLQAEHEVSEEALRPWFPLNTVLSGLFEIAHRLFGITIAQKPGVAVWHPDAQYYEVHAADHTLIGGFYTDLHARENKRGGAWMSEVIGRFNAGEERAYPVANLVCNFSPPSASAVSLLTHRDVVTLFHEFGHTLHHLMTQVDYPSLAGINGVAWDAVELPSQLMENWAWEPSVLPLISAHVQTGDPLPMDKLQALLGSRSFHAGLAASRQLEFAMIDFELHARRPPIDDTSLKQLIDGVRARVSAVQPPLYNRQAHSFTHIFSGGYAAGYYSYKWAEVLAADGFSAFTAAGVFDQRVARRFLSEILSRGGVVDQMEAFISFRGRQPEITALLRQEGIAA
jgi:oligopeptidase A